MLLDRFIGSEKEVNAKNQTFQEIILFIAPAELMGLENNVKSLEIAFEDENQKKTCVSEVNTCATYSGCF